VPKFPLDANGEPIVPPMTEQELAAWLRLSAKPAETGGTPPASYPFCRRDPCPHWRGYCRRDPACND
jgi:hypothetical protein